MFDANFSGSPQDQRVQFEPFEFSFGGFNFIHISFNNEANRRHPYSTHTANPMTWRPLPGKLDRDSSMVLLRSGTGVTITQEEALDVLVVRSSKLCIVTHVISIVCFFKNPLRAVRDR